MLYVLLESINLTLAETGMKALGHLEDYLGTASCTYVEQIGSNTIGKHNRLSK